MKYVAGLRAGLCVSLLPLLLMGWSSLQAWRASSPMDTAHIMQQWIARPADTLLAQLPANERAMPLRDADRRAHFQRQIEWVDANRNGLQLRLWLAHLAFWLALLALLSGPATCLKILVDAWRARLSQDFFQRRLGQSWRSLGHCLVVYNGLLLAALTLILLYETGWVLSNRQQGSWAALVFCAPLLSVLYAGLLLTRRLRQRWHELQAGSSVFLGRPLDRASAPALWNWIGQLAERIGAPMPDHLVAGLDQSFFVTSVPVRLQPSAQVLEGRTLYLPLTYLSAMSQEEVAAIIGHELAHFANRDTECSSTSAAYFRQMSLHYRSLAGEEQQPTWIERPAIWVAGLFLHHFAVAVHHWSRHQEIAADAAAARVSGHHLFCQALLRVVALSEAITEVIGQRHPGDRFQALAARLRQRPLTLDEASLGRTVSHPFDTHPPTSQRLERLGVSLDTALLARATRVPEQRDSDWFGHLLGAARAAPYTAPGTPANERQ
ncbi:Zn-dependent protease with chaperone function [Pseudomonas flavescens]|uniref:Zn-dependent protease with chaperone function n=1 Tax=Phytopseudomonas flavescens TaxID=29435 RepID=A0A1G8HQZ2_9GAMM|nr:M48 family metallopeptidase [Pseudomonas flavescens]SDI09065.1 Zn-dependent protease with chaperone function [Pseudomonas flavescens]